MYHGVGEISLMGGTISIRVMKGVAKNLKCTQLERLQLASVDMYYQMVTLYEKD